MLARGGRLVYVDLHPDSQRKSRSDRRFLAQETADAAACRREEWRGWPGFGEADGSGGRFFPGEAAADGFYYAALNKQ